MPILRHEKKILFYDFQVAKIKFLVTFKTHFKNFDDFQYTKIKFLLTFKAKNEIFIVDFFGNLGPLCLVLLHYAIFISEEVQ